MCPARFSIAISIWSRPPEISARPKERLAVSACKATGYRSFRTLDVLAAAYAAVGRFDDAVKAAEDALKLALEKQESGQSEHVPKIEHRLRLYKAREPFRMETRHED